MTILKSFILAVVVLVAFSLFLRTQVFQEDAVDETQTLPSTEQQETKDTFIPLTDNNKDIDTRTTIDESEKTETIVCPDDVYICEGGGFGTPTYNTELRRVPPSCEFPACPG